MNQLFKVNLLFCLAFVLAIGSWSCKSNVQAGNKAAVSVPSTAASVSSFNFANLMKKVDFEAVKEMEMYKKAVAEAGKEQAAFAEILQDPASSGIDLNKDAYLFMDGTASNSSGGMVMNLADAAAFATLIDKAQLGTLTKEGAVNLMKSEQGEIVAWNDEVAFIGSGYGKMANSELVATIFSGERNKSIVENPSYKKLMTSDHDVNTWVNFNPFLKELPPMAKMQATMLGIDEDALTDNFMHGHWDFKDGEMEGLMSYAVKDGLVKDFSAFFKQKVSTDFANKIPGDYLGAAMALGLDLKGINQVLKEKGMQELANLQVEAMDLSLDELADGLGGDFAFAVYPEMEGNTEVLMTMDVKDDKLSQKLVDLGLKLGAFTSAGDGLYKMPNTGGKMRKSFQMKDGEEHENNRDGWFLVKDDLMYLTSSATIAKQVQSGNFKKASKIDNLQETLGGTIVGGFFNFEAMQALAKDFDASRFDSWTFSGSRENTRMKLKTNDKSENSLKTLFLSLEEQFKKENMSL